MEFRNRMQRGRWLSSVAGVALFVLSTQSAAVSILYGFSQAGFDGGASVLGTFAAEDLDGNGQISSFSGEVSNFSMSFSGNSLVGPFSLGSGDLFGLVWDTKDQFLGDGFVFDVEGIGADDLVRFEYSAGPGPVAQCGIGLVCGVVRDFLLETLSGSKEFVIVVLGGLDDTGNNPASQTQAAAEISQTVSIGPTAVSGAAKSALHGGRGRVRAVGLAPPGTSFARSDAVGRAAGDEMFGGWPISTWASFSHTHVDNDFPTIRFDSDLNTFFGGADIPLGEKAIVGLALGYENQDTDTGFNRGTQDSDHVSVVPYVGYLFNDTLSADFSLGYTHRDIDQVRRNLVGMVFKSDLDSYRLFGSGNLNAVRPWGPVTFSGTIGYLYVREKLGNFVETSPGLADRFVPSRTVHLGQGKIGGSISYFQNGWEPFASAYLVHDFTRTKVAVGAGQARPSEDNTEVQLGVGLHYFGEKSGLTGGLELVSVQGRDDVDSHSINLTVRWDY